jgi:glycosyltransferase involved in cell wall biosynthesis
MKKIKGTKVRFLFLETTKHIGILQMKIQTIITCVNYSDYLSETLPFNKRHFDELIIVTTPEDVETQKVCANLKVPFVTTNSFYDNGASFNKGRGINFGIQWLQNPDWILHMDADIVLPPMTRAVLDKAQLNEQHIYGIDRMNCPTFAEWRKYLQETYAQHENSIYIHPGPWGIGTRMMYLEYGGYVPLGFFQLFNANSHVVATTGYYPEEYHAADYSDIKFSLKWARTHRHLLPEIVGIHLMTEDSYCGVNWRGRRSQRFA